MKSKGREAMGSRKHGKSGHAGKSPKFRHWMKRQAEREERKRGRRTVWFGSVSDYMKGEQG